MLPPALTGSGVSVMTSARSACGVTVAFTTLLLFVPTGSDSLAVTATVAETLESVVALIVAVTVAEPLLASEPTLQELPTHVPCVVTRPVSVPLPGVTVTVTPVAPAGPLFFTGMVTVQLLLWTTVAGAVAAEMSTSACGITAASESVVAVVVGVKKPVLFGPNAG
jgi:hypothetical protein